jgi:hypothetical protein
MPSSPILAWGWILLAPFCLVLASCGKSPAAGDSRTTAGELHLSIPVTRGGTDDLALDNFQFDGAAVNPNTARVRDLAPGVHEVTADAASIGDWGFAVRDLSSYYGFGERFDRKRPSNPG